MHVKLQVWLAKILVIGSFSKIDPILISCILTGKEFLNFLRIQLIYIKIKPHSSYIAYIKEEN